jgi:hypothetical protein
MKLLTHAIALFALLFCFTGCVTPTPLPAGMQYVAPPPGPAVASIKGYKATGFLDYTTLSVLSIDGKRVTAKIEPETKPITLRPGKRKLEVQFNRGAWFAVAELEVEVVAGQNYTLKHNAKTVFGTHEWIDFWVINDASQKAASKIQRTTVGLQSATPIIVPIIL